MSSSRSAVSAPSCSVSARWRPATRRRSARILACSALSDGLSSDYSEHLGEELSAAFRETAAAARDEQARKAAEHLAEVFGKDRYVATNERRRTRRREIAERLREPDAFEDSAEVADLE
jgi:hypothetical protein